MVIITNKNFNDFVQIPNYIIFKMIRKKISLTHFSDILRVNLLAKFGGIWIDSTVFFNERIEDFINCQNELVTVTQFRVDYNISSGKWSSWFIGTKSVLPYFKVCVEFFNAYWKNNNYLINYFLIDYIIYFLYKNTSFSYFVDNVKKSCFSAYDLMNVRNTLCNKSHFNEFLKEHPINKLKPIKC